MYITQVPGVILEQRQEIIVEMAERGIECNVHYKPLPLLTAYKNLGFDIKDFEKAYNQYKEEILPEKMKYNLKGIEKTSIK